MVWRVCSSTQNDSTRCKNTVFKNVMFRRQVVMFLNQPELDVSFKISYEGKAYMVYTSTSTRKCFECGDVGHKMFTCPHKAGSSGVNITPNPIADSEVINESNGEEMNPNEANPIADSEVIDESTGEEMTTKEVKESDGNDIASCSSAGNEIKTF